jgi:hypothetical protein
MEEMMDAKKKAEIRHLAQQKLAQAADLLREAGDLANQGRFDLEFMNAVYLPAGATQEESDAEDWPLEIAGEEVVPGEWWMPSTC